MNQTTEAKSRETSQKKALRKHKGNERGKDRGSQKNQGANQPRLQHEKWKLDFRMVRKTGTR